MFIDDAMDSLEKNVSREWLEDSHQSQHPFRQAWRAHQGRSVGKPGPLPEALPKVTAYVDALRQLESFPRRAVDGVLHTDDRFCRRLWNRAIASTEEFEATELEAIVGLAHHVDFRIPMLSLDVAAERTPDFEADFDGRRGYIECKVRSIETREHGLITNVRREILRRIEALLRVNSTNYGIAVSTDHVPKPESVDTIVRAVQERVHSGKPFADTVDDFRLEGVVFLHANDEIVTPALEPLDVFEHVPEPMRGFLLEHGTTGGRTYALTSYWAEMKPVPGAIFCRNPRAVVAHIRVTPNHTKATVECVKAARPQLPRDAIGVVAVKPPEFYGNEQFRQFGQELRAKASSSGRISGVQLWHQAIAATSDASGPPSWRLWWQVIWLPNPRARLPLAREFVNEHLKTSQRVEVFA